MSGSRRRCRRAADQFDCRGGFSNHTAGLFAWFGAMSKRTGRLIFTTQSTENTEPDGQMSQTPSPFAMHMLGCRRHGGCWRRRRRCANAV